MKENKKWILVTTVVTFILALLFGGVSNVIVERMNSVVATIVLIIVITIGILFDMIGMAIATCSEAPFHAKAAKKHIGAKEALKVIKEKEKTINICNDLMGDICGIISGSICALIAVKLSIVMNIDIVIISLVLTAVVAAITVGLKALGKKIAIDNCNNIMYMVGAVMHIIKPLKKINK